MSVLPFLQKLIKKFHESEERDAREANPEKHLLTKPYQKVEVGFAHEFIERVPSKRPPSEQCLYDYDAFEDSLPTHADLNDFRLSLESSRTETTPSETYIRHENDMQIESNSPVDGGLGNDTSSGKDEGLTNAGDHQREDSSRNVSSNRPEMNRIELESTSRFETNRLAHNTRQSRGLHAESVLMMRTDLSEESQERVKQIVEGMCQLREDVARILGPKSEDYIRMHSMVDEILAALRVQPPVLPDQSIMQMLDVDCRYRFLCNYTFEGDNELAQFMHTRVHSDHAAKTRGPPKTWNGLKKQGPLDVDISANLIEYFIWVLQISRAVAPTDFDAVLYFTIELMRRLLTSST